MAASSNVRAIELPVRSSGYDDFKYINMTSRASFARRLRKTEASPQNSNEYFLNLLIITIATYHVNQAWSKSVADPGFPMGGGGGGRGPIGGHGPPIWVLFAENVCKNERILFHRGGGVH